MEHVKIPESINTKADGPYFVNLLCLLPYTTQILEVEMLVLLPKIFVVLSHDQPHIVLELTPNCFDLSSSLKVSDKHATYRSQPQ